MLHNVNNFTFNKIILKNNKHRGELKNVYVSIEFSFGVNIASPWQNIEKL